MATEVVLPKLGLTQEEGTVVRWIKPEGSRVAKGEPLFEVMTDKATIEVEAPASGVLLRILVPEGTTAPVATPIALIGEPGERVAAGAPPAAAAPVVPRAAQPSASVFGSNAADGSTAAPRDGRVRVSPRARVLAASHGVDLRALRGSGPDGRIIERDVQRALDAGVRGTGAAAAVPAAPVVPAAVSARMRAVIARRMTESLQSTAQLTLTTEADMAEASKLREEAGAELERRGGARPTFTDLIVRAAAIALRDHPRLNARWTDGGARLLPEIHVGVAVALDEGLVVPVIRRADRASLAEISAALRDLSERARTFRLAPAEME
ncbi:MAG: dihydrolipoamide acetyltransferase family protein, partial [bacterium]